MTSQSLNNEKLWHSNFESESQLLLNAIQSTVDDDAVVVVVVVVTCTRALCSLDLDLVVVVVTHRKRHQTLDIYATTRHGTTRHNDNILFRESWKREGLDAEPSGRQLWRSS